MAYYIVKKIKGMSQTFFPIEKTIFNKEFREKKSKKCPQKRHLQMKGYKMRQITETTTLCFFPGFPKIFKIEK